MSSLRVIDLFCGCGGMSLGFKRAGFEILGGVELDPKAAETYAKNLFAGSNPETIKKHAEAKDINLYHPEHFARDFLGSEDFDNQADVIIGGPPCQAFARIGRAKLREIMNHEQAYLKDHRAGLYTHFLMYVEAFKPKAVVMENVPEILSYGGKNVGEEIAASLAGLGYRAAYTLMNAAHFGVPQTRVRFFLIAYLEELHQDPLFPAPTHFIETRNNMYLFPANGDSSKASKSQLAFFEKERQSDFTHYAGPLIPKGNLTSAVTTYQAIGDLPAIDGSRINEPPRKIHFTINREYREGVASDYAQLMKDWPGFKSDGGVDAHVIRSISERDYEIFRRMKQGDQYPQAYAIAWENFARKIASMVANGDKVPSEKEEAFQDLKRSCVPPYPANKFPNKWQKLDPGMPAHTITAHLGKDTYSHIHYDSDQARTISVREAARLQSFPDGFHFPTTLTHSYRQIGNAIPPLLAYQIAKHIKAVLEAKDT